MLSPKDTVYPRFKKNISRKEINKLYTPTVEEIAMAQKRKRADNRKNKQAYLKKCAGTRKGKVGPVYNL